MTAARQSDSARTVAADIATWQSFLETTSELARLVAMKLRHLGLSSSDFTVLDALSRMPDATARFSELAAGMRWERSRLSHHLERMEARGLVERRHLDAVSRPVQVTLTPRGSALYARAAEPYWAAIRAYFTDALTPAQLAALADILQTLQRRLTG